MSTSSSPILQALARLSRPAPSRGSKAPRKPAAFFAEGRLPLDSLSVHVDGLGDLPQPVPRDMARALQAASTPARYGRRQATLMDRRVRDTGEIAPEALYLQWPAGALPALLADIAQALGLHALEARVHNLLVYGPGQFFKPHQDTEKHPGMVATLVLAWPSAHIGGELRVQHGKEEACFTSQHLDAGDLRWFAFYADCRHEVLPVAEGWRIVLTFDLVVPAAPAVPRPQADPALVAALDERFGIEARTTPWAFFLDHEYTEHGLRWGLLKGEDTARVAALRAAAEALGFVVHLALASIHQQWTAVESERSYRGRRGGIGSPEPGELLDDDVTLDFWIDTHDRPVKGSPLHLPARETDSFTPTGPDHLVEEEYEGYMGNYGETLDYWYRRAALVIQTPMALEANRFRIDFKSALAKARTLARQGQGQELARLLEAAAGAITSQCSQQGRALLGAYSELAAALPDPVQARKLCEGFRWVDLQPKDAAHLARLAKHRNPLWMQELVRGWMQAAKAWHRVMDGRQQGLAPPWPRPIVPFIAAVRRVGLDGPLVDTMLQGCVASLAQADRSVGQERPVTRQSELPMRLQAVGELAAALEASPHAAALVRHVQAQPVVYPLLRLRPLLLAFGPATAATREAKALRGAVVKALRKALARPALPAGDHSMQGVEWACRCERCRPLIAWAESPANDPLVLALDEGSREHVQGMVQAAGAGLAFETVKQGRPYKLVARKAPGLHEKRAALRKEWAADLAALED